MKKTLPPKIEQYRITTGTLASYSSLCLIGAFLIPYKTNKLTSKLRVISSYLEDWDHVSVSLRHRSPTWAEMCYVKDIFFEPEETVIQYHPPKSKYINQHPYVLHMWRQHGVEYELPPWWMI
jgi:hypothetical protein